VVQLERKLSATISPNRWWSCEAARDYPCDQVAAGALGRAVEAATQYDRGAPRTDGLSQTVTSSTSPARSSGAFVTKAATTGDGREDPEVRGAFQPRRPQDTRVRLAIPFSSRIPRQELCGFCGHRYSLHTHEPRNVRACQYKYCQCPFFERAKGAPRRP